MKSDTNSLAQDKHSWGIIKTISKFVKNYITIPHICLLAESGLHSSRKSKGK